MIKEAKAELCIDLGSESMVKAVSAALKPDDNPPKGFIIEHELRGKVLCYRVLAKIDRDKDLLTLLSILDEVTRLCESVEECVKHINTA